MTGPDRTGPPHVAAAMRLAIDQSQAVKGSTYPNPPVGAVILDSAGEIVGVGATQAAGGAHAEVMALRAAGERAAGGTAVVTLEPCNHHGRTPPCTDALLAAGVERKQLSFDYRARSTDEKTRRIVSPQRVTHYRGNWYLDALDHDREALRSFSVDRIATARMQDAPAQDVPDGELNDHLAGSYGIFSGAPKGWATIVFNPKIARWVADEHWHSQQQDRFLPDGRFERKVPYSAPRELLMDILHYGPDAEIVEPASLREQMKSMLQLAVSNYEK